MLFARGHVPRSNHYIGAACDNQTGWNKAPAYMYHVGDLIRQAGLYDGCRFVDCGHVEAVRGTHNRPPNLYAAIEKFKSEQSTATINRKHHQERLCCSTTQALLLDRNRELFDGPEARAPPPANGLRRHG